MLPYQERAVFFYKHSGSLHFFHKKQASDLAENEQGDLVTVMDKLSVIPARNQLAKIKENSKDGTLTIAVMEALLKAEHHAVVQVVFKQARLHQYFPPSYTAQQMEEVIVSLLETWKIQHL